MKSLILMVLLVVCVVGTAPAQLIPTMTSSNTPSGLATSSSVTNGPAQPYYAFTVTNVWGPGVSLNTPFLTNGFIEYQFPSAVTVNAFSGYFSCQMSYYGSLTNTANMVFSSSPDGSSWTPLASNIVQNTTTTGSLPSSPAFISNAIPVTTAAYFKWAFTAPTYTVGTNVFNMLYFANNAQLYGTTNTLAMVPILSPSLQFWTTNGGSASLNVQGVCASNNVVMVTLNSNVVFQSNPTAFVDTLWRIQGSFQMDNSNNLSTSVTMIGADGLQPQFFTFTNQNPTNFNFSIGTSPTGNTNLTINTLTITAGQGISGAQPIYQWPAMGGGTNGINGTNGAPGTNMVTAYNLTNAVLSSRFYTLLSSNYFVFTGSNDLGTFPQLQSAKITTPMIGAVGLSPGSNAVENLFGTTNGGASWFGISSLVTVNITNSIHLAVVGDSNSAPGSVFLQGVDHPELVGRTNTWDGQYYQFPDAIGAFDAVNLETANALIANALNGNFVTSTDTNQVSHATLTEFGNQVVDVSYNYSILPNNLSVSGTNLLLKIVQTNLTTGWTLQYSTNLNLKYQWLTFTNYTTSTSGSPAVVTFTIPINKTQAQIFLVPRGNGLVSMTVTPPLGMLGGAYYPSNSWSLFAVTNGMANMSFKEVNSNGVTMLMVYMSNGVPYFKALWP